MQIRKRDTTVAFIDASNLFYGGQKSLGWRIDYRRLLKYLRNKYDITTAMYFGGVEIYDFFHDYIKDDTVSIEKLENHLLKLTLKAKMLKLKQSMLKSHIQRVKFYKNLKRFGYSLYLKPVKSYYQKDGAMKRKANCDVDMTFHLMKNMNTFSRAVVLSGDGDFLPVLKYLKRQSKKIIILARSKRTAREIRQFAGGDFRDFEYLRYLLEVRP
ncbi:MAG: NYN domain-containing protein [Parcubacteria group bacterium]